MAYHIELHKLIIYDVLFTSVLPLMEDLYHRLDGLPYAPLVAWSVGSEGHWFG